MPEQLNGKRKRTKSLVDIPTKKQKITGESKSKERDTEFHVVKTQLVVSIAPVFSGKPRAGVEEMLDSMVMRYIPALRGVVLSHSNLHFLSDTAVIQADCPYLVCKIEFDATIWSPHVGMKLVGKVNLCSPDHVSLLLHRTFNVSIPRHHVPGDQWVFEYGPAENDPEFGPNANIDEADEEVDGDGGGRWVHHLTGDKLGGTNGYLEFTVIGLTVANEMLSLLGSIQPDPFSPEHKPTVGVESNLKPTESELDDFEVEHEIELQEEGSDDHLEEFGILGRGADGEAGQQVVEEIAPTVKGKKRKKEESADSKQRKHKRKGAKVFIDINKNKCSV